MNSDKTNGAGFKAMLSMLALGLLTLVFAGQADAACMGIPQLRGVPTARAEGGAMIPAVYRPGELARGGSLFPVGDFEGDGPSIVGLWQFQMSGFSVDWGTQAWHSDGTEIMFSGGQNPETGDVCQGVWRQVGPSTYTLNHIAMGWVAPGAGFGIRVHFHVKVKLDPTGNSFTGTYTAGVFAVSPADPFDETTEVASGAGTVTATRVKPD